MSKYGNIQRMVRETYGAETGFPIWTSVRGLYMELKEGEEIPATVNIRNMRARVFYDGLVNKCYQCGSTEHIKADCPERKSVNDRLKTGQTGSYSGALKGFWSKPKPSSNLGQQVDDGKMTNLNELVAAVSSSSAGKSPALIEGKEKSDAPAPVEQNDGHGKRTERNEKSTTTIAAAQHVARTPAMEALGASHTEATASVSQPTDACGEVSQAQHMETEACSLKRGRDLAQCKDNEETDDSSLSDTSNAEKVQNEEKTAISGWQMVSARTRNKQLKLSQSKGRSKSANSHQ